MSKLYESRHIISIADASCTSHAGDKVLIKTNDVTSKPGVSCHSIQP
jgi:hypothetical protein